MIDVSNSKFSKIFSKHLNSLNFHEPLKSFIEDLKNKLHLQEDIMDKLYLLLQPIFNKIEELEEKIHSRDSLVKDLSLKIADGQSKMYNLKK